MKKQKLVLNEVNRGRKLDMYELIGEFYQDAINKGFSKPYDVGRVICTSLEKIGYEIK